MTKAALCDHHDHRPMPDREATDAEIEAAAALFQALSDPARLRLIVLISNQEVCVSELVAVTGEKMTAVSQRLTLLHRHHLLIRRREGKHIYYRLADDHVLLLAKNALSHAAETTASPRQISKESAP